MSWTIDWADRFALFRFSGQMSVEDMLQANLACQADPRFDSLRFIIGDCSRITEFRPDHGDTDELWARDAGAYCSNPSLRKFIVTTNPQVMRIAQAYAQSDLSLFPLQVFERLEEALACAQARPGSGGQGLSPPPSARSAPAGPSSSPPWTDTHH